MKRSKKSTVNTIIVMIVLAGLIFCAFMYITNKEDKEKVEVAVEQTEVEKLLAKDNVYPPTPREVLKRYCRILKCIYSGETTDEEVASLGEQVLNLYSDELLEKNPHDDYMNQLTGEVISYREGKKTVDSYAIDSGDNVITWKENEKEYARILAVFTLKEDSSYVKTCEEFLLEKNESGQWKIVGWRLADKEDL